MALFVAPTWGMGAVSFPSVKKSVLPVGNRIYEVRPIPGEAYSASFMKFCQSRRFSSVSDAARAVKNRAVPFLIRKAVD